MKKRTVVILILLPIITALICICAGRMGIGPGDVFKTFFGSKDVSGNVRITVMNIRLPRILLGLLCGAGLSLAGCCFQGFFSNPLATPDTMGVAGGASFGAALGLLLGFDMIGVQLLSFGMGLAAVIFTKAAASGREHGPAVLVISGIMVGALFSALVSLVKFLADSESQLPAITYWLMGSLGGTGYKKLALGAPIIIIGIIIISLLRWRINLLALSEDELIASGTNVKLLRSLVVICATAMTASVISMCGQVGWVGLIVPHMCRLIWGQDN
ncbi:MAG: iron ABC transporter permease, partial [Lachnospiraceae bacterium]|nr:iron ABC transporter permease [Lachnospiraceae bacterium]